MNILVTNCEHYNGHVCKKCGRMVPARCKDFEELERKAKLYDAMGVDTRESESIRPPVPYNVSQGDTPSEPEETVETPVAKKRPGRPRRS